MSIPKRYSLFSSSLSQWNNRNMFNFSQFPLGQNKESDLPSEKSNSCSEHQFLNHQCKHHRKGNCIMEKEILAWPILICEELALFYGCRALHLIKTTRISPLQGMKYIVFIQTLSIYKYNID